MLFLPVLLQLKLPSPCSVFVAQQFLHVPSSVSDQAVSYNRPCLRPFSIHAVIYMGPSSCSLYPYEDPWRASAFIFAFTQLLLTVLVLLHTIIVCITCQLMKWYGWGYLSCHESAYQRESTLRFESGVVKKPSNLDSNAIRSNPLISTEKFYKRTRSEDWRAVKSRSLICPKCHGLWNLKQGLSFRYDKDAISQSRETPTSLDADISPVGRFPRVEAGIRRNSGYGSKASNACDSVKEAGHGMLHVETVYCNEDNFDLNTPVHGTPRVVKKVALETSVLREKLEEDVGSSSKDLRENGLHTVSLNSAGLDESFESIPCVLKEMQEEFADEDLSAAPRKEGDGMDHSFGSVTKGSWDEQLTTLKDDHKDYDSESVIKGLKDAVFRERKKLCALYGELEIERISSETAANEAMSMITRLQEEKAALRMQAAHYRRIAEERAIYDEQAMQLLKDILVKKEKENFLLENEVKGMRTRFGRDVKRYGKRRQGVDRRSSSGVGQGRLLLKNEEAVDGVHVFGTKTNGSVEEPRSPSQVNEKQPFKRLKGSRDDDSRKSQLTLSGGSKMAHKHVLDLECSCERQHSAAAFVCTGCEEVSAENGLIVQEMGFEGKHLVSLRDVCEDRNESFEGLLMDPSTSLQELKPSLFDTKDFLSQIVEGSLVKKGIEVNQLGECSKEQGAVCLDNGVLDTFADEVSSNVVACFEETWDFAAVDALHFPNAVLECNTRKDLQARVQACQVDKLPQSCPSSLNPKGSGFNNLKE